MKNAKKIIQRLAGIVLSLPMIIITLEYSGYGIGINLHYNTTILTLICSLSGALSALILNDLEKDKPFKHNIELRTSAGAVTGSLSMWIFYGYIWLRGFPESIFKIEFLLVFALTLLPGIVFYKIFKPKQI